MTSIDTLPDDVLLELFKLYLYYDEYDDMDGFKREKAWRALVHVCRRWRCVVFGSPRHLDLRLVCMTRRPVRDMLDVWPALPLKIVDDDLPIGSVDNIIAALDCTDRVREIFVDDSYWSSSDLEIFLASMQRPFPELTYLWLSSAKTVAVVPDSLLGGSAPRLEGLELEGIPYPGLPKLLLSTTHLVNLRLDHIPHSGYFSPDAMVTTLSTLTSLESLWLKFHSPRSCPDWASRPPPPSTRSVLPVLTSLWFWGASEYWEDFVAQIDAPQLDHLQMAFFNDIVFDTPQSIQFISRTPISRALENARIYFQDSSASVNFLSQTSVLEVDILCRGLDWQVFSLEQFCTSCLPPLSMLKDLYIQEILYWSLDWEDSIENSQWLELLHPFIEAKNLYLSEKVASHIVPALQELLEGRTTEVLPTLQNIFLRGLQSSGPVQEGIVQFAAARQVVRRPIAVSHWTSDQEDKV